MIFEFDDLVLPNEIKHKLKTCERNLILYGRPGCGKTSLVYILQKMHDYELVFINAATENGIDVARNIEEKINCHSLFNKGKKMIVFNEAARMTSALQEALKTIIETRTDVIWVFTTNMMNINSAIVSRCELIDYDKIFNNEEYANEMVKQLGVRTKNILSTKFTTDEIKSVINKDDLRVGLTDIRQWTENLFTMIETGQLSRITIKDSECEEFIDFMDAILEGRSWDALGCIRGKDPDAILEFLTRKVLPRYKEDWNMSTTLATVLHDYDFRLRFVVMPELAKQVLVSNLIKVIKK